MTTQDEEQVRRSWRLLWLSSLRAFSDDAMQAGRWTDLRESNPYYSFVECMCSYFDDACLIRGRGYAERIEWKHLSEAEAKTVEGFHRLAAAYNSPNGDDYDIASILSDPKWRDVVAAAKTAIATLLPLLGDEQEIRALTSPLGWERDGNTFHDDLLGSTYVR